MNAQSSAHYQESRTPLIKLLLASPIIWSVYHIIGYFLVEIACTTGLPSGRLLGVGTMTIIVAILTLLSLGAIILIGFLSFRHMRAADENIATGDSRERFLGMVAGLFSIVLALTVLLDGSALLVLGPCGAAF